MDRGGSIADGKHSQRMFARALRDALFVLFKAKKSEKKRKGINEQKRK